MKPVLAVIISVSRERLIYSLILALNSHNIQRGIEGEGRLFAQFDFCRFDPPSPALSLFPALGSEHINPRDPMGILALTSNRRCYYTPAIYHVLRPSQSGNNLDAILLKSGMCGRKLRKNERGTERQAMSARWNI